METQQQTLAQELVQELRLILCSEGVYKPVTSSEVCRTVGDDLFLEMFFGAEVENGPRNLDIQDLRTNNTMSITQWRGYGSLYF